jgi:hypothetical protein
MSSVDRMRDGVGRSRGEGKGRPREVILPHANRRMLPFVPHVSGAGPRPVTVVGVKRSVQP